MLALALFIASAAALGQLIRVGMKSAEWSNLRTAATIRCETRMNELIAGIEILESTDARPDWQDPMWEHEVRIEPTSIPTLQRIIVITRHFRTPETKEYDVEIALVRFHSTELTDELDGDDLLEANNLGISDSTLEAMLEVDVPEGSQ